MFRAGTPWKLWLLSATVIWGLLAAVDLAETTGPEKLVGGGQVATNALHRRTPTKATLENPIDAQCGNSFNNPSRTSKIPDGAVACTAYGGRTLACYGQCEIIIETREKIDWIPFHFPLPESFTFGACRPMSEKYPLHVNVYPDKFWAHNHNGKMLVEGSDRLHNPKVGKKDLKFYLCPWRNADEINNQRPCQRPARELAKNSPEHKIERGEVFLYVPEKGCAVSLDEAPDARLGSDGPDGAEDAGEGAAVLGVLRVPRLEQDLDAVERRYQRLGQAPGGPAIPPATPGLKCLEGVEEQQSSSSSSPREENLRVRF
ncbi:hypothetical protein PCANC_26066 [Puccinia coronata f. sp. avenae]|uniref:CxC6 like cysteine cluster associated with KDZ domain-containing protein n=1 Tax=Puccinia coronata f. sp. avenae TaxID=200324 RepID=A0A2N5TJ17_9BASI|nr:hypothetical protein PCANC_26066 [Puccinia coronata f. sp. avenae]